MIITKTKRQNGAEFTKEMEEKYNSIEELEKLFNKSNNMKMYVDLENWRYFKEHPDETIETKESRFLNYH